ncbi:MAG: phosphoribosylamine--glycine ligase [Bacteroidales bacterium]|nr:phosphoribosylamine--glycine ligase [Bacteroidales bacterium]
MSALNDAKVLVVGGGGREHAIVDALSRSSHVGKIYCAPGNAGIAAQAECVPIKDTDIEGLLAFVKEKGVDLTVVGPEASLSVGIVDLFTKEGETIFGPTKAAATIESSKDFAKRLMEKYGVPTAAYKTFEEFEEALEYVKEGSFPVVLKYDGLAAGKGVVIAESIAEAEAALKDMLLDDKFGHGKVVVEEFMTGPEFSFLCFVCGKEVFPMVLSQDHKRAFDGDKGPNTGGMGAYSPLPFITEEDYEYALDRIMKPVAAGMVEEGCPFKGVLYGGLMKTPSGIKVVEFNCRFGDPETEVVLPRLKTDIFEVFCAIAAGGSAPELPEGTIAMEGLTVPASAMIPELKWYDEATLGFVMASKGYPGSYEKGFKITGLDEALSDPAIRIFHMGTKASETEFTTAGGRVLMVVGAGKDLKEARDKALAAVRKIKCDNLFYRTDIGHWVL